MGATATTTAATRGAIDALERLYRFREPDEVRTYLAKNSDLLDLLNEAAAKIPEFLPVDEAMILEVAWDPEDEEDEEDGLFALVSTRLEPEAVRPQLDRLRRDWLVPVFRRTGGRFNVGIEYR
jgi:hypothetical protein